MLPAGMISVFVWVLAVSCVFFIISLIAHLHTVKFIRYIESVLLENQAAIGIDPVLSPEDLERIFQGDGTYLKLKKTSRIIRKLYIVCFGLCITFVAAGFYILVSVF